MELPIKTKLGIIESLAYRFSDTNYKKFIQSEYQYVIGESLRELSKKYHLDTRFTSSTITEKDLESEIKLDIPDPDMFRFESRVEVNKVVLDKVNEFTKNTTLSTSKEYILKVINGDIFFDYYPKTIGDVYSIRYNVLPGAEGMIEIPLKYKEELLDIATIALAKIGLTKNNDEGHQNMYATIIKMYQFDKRNIEPDNVVDEQWIEIKPYLPV